MRTKQSILLLLVSLMLVFTTWLSRQQKMLAARQELDQTQHLLSSLRYQIDSLNEDLLVSREQMQKQRTINQTLKTEVAVAEGEINLSSPDARWVTPPEVLPQWNPASPYVWVQKEVMKQLHQRPFTAEGTLPMEATVVLALDPGHLKELNRLLASILAEYRKLESGTVRYTNQHLIPISPGSDALTITWNPPKDEAIRFRSAFEAILREQLGNQRTDLLLALDSGRLDEDFGQIAEGESLKITVRKKDDQFDIAIQGSSWLQTSAPKEYLRNLEHHIPVHLRPFFSSLLESP